MKMARIALKYEQFLKDEALRQSKKLQNFNSTSNSINTENISDPELINFDKETKEIQKLKEEIQKIRLSTENEKRELKNLNCRNDNELPNLEFHHQDKLKPDGDDFFEIVKIYENNVEYLQNEIDNFPKAEISEFTKIKDSIQSKFKQKEQEKRVLKLMVKNSKTRCFELQKIINKLEYNSDVLKKPSRDDIIKMKKVFEIESKLKDHELKKLMRQFEEEQLKANQEILNLSTAAEHDRKKFQDEIESLKLKIDNQTKSHDKLKQMKEEILTEKTEIEESLKQLKEHYETTLQSLKNELHHEKQLNIDKISQLEILLEEESQKYKNSNVKSLEELDDKTQYCLELEIIIKNLGDANELLETEIDKIKNKCQNDISTVYKNLEETKTCFEEKYKILSKQLTDKNTEFEELNNIKQQIEKENKLLKSEMESLQKAKTAEIHILTEDFSKEKQIFQKDKKTLLATLNQIIQEKTNLKDLQTKTQNELDEINKSYTELNVKKLSLEENLKHLKEKILDMKKTFEDQLKKTKTNIELNNQFYENKIKNLRDDLEEKTKNFEEIDKIKRNLENNIIYLKETLNKKELINKEKLISLSNDLELNKNLYETEISKFQLFDDKISDKDIQNLNSFFSTDFPQIWFQEIEKMRNDIKLEKEYYEEEIEKLKKRQDTDKTEKIQEFQDIRLELRQQKKYCESLEKAKQELEKSNQCLSVSFEEFKDAANDERLKNKLIQERNTKRHKEETSKLKQEIEILSNYTQDLEKIRKDMERENKMLQSKLDQANSRHLEGTSILKDEIRNIKKSYETRVQMLRNDFQNQKNNLEAVIYRLKSEIKTKFSENCSSKCASNDNKSSKKKVLKVRKDLSHKKY